MGWTGRGNEKGITDFCSGLVWVNQFFFSEKIMGIGVLNDNDRWIILLVPSKVAVLHGRVVLRLFYNNKRLQNNILITAGMTGSSREGKKAARMNNGYCGMIRISVPP